MALVWKHTQFTKFLKKNPRQAFEYRRDCFPGVAGYEIPNEYLTDAEKAQKPVKDTKNTPVVTQNEKQDTTPAKEVKDTSDKDFENNTEEDVTNIEITEEEVKEKLKDAGVKFHHKAKLETLVKLAIENKVL